MNKNIFKHILVGCALVMSTSSCSDWLDVQPNSQVKSSELFKTESGFKEALAGVYTLLTDETIYGKELTYGMMGVLSHEWINFPTSYTDDAAYNYTATLSQGRIENIWSKMYNAISNTNYLLENIENANVFKANNKDIIKGEALALRALMHFDLLRCFGVNYSTNPNQPAIPYITDYSAKQSKQLTVSQVIENVIKDLNDAKALLKNDPIYTGKSITEIDDNGYLMNRSLHMNYYAAEALLARVYLYINDYEKAKTAAQIVISSNKFKFTNSDDFTSGLDKLGATEQIFGLQINNLDQRNTNYLSQEGTNTFSVDAEAMSSYLNNNTDDYRYFLYERGTLNNSINNYYVTKYAELRDDLISSVSNPSYYQNKLPIIKLPEMYLILAEAKWKLNESALANYNTYLNSRGIKSVASMPTDFRTVLDNEYRKEFIAEGQLFFYYKRTNKEFVTGSDVNLVNSKSYTFPIPERELESADRQPNK